MTGSPPESYLGWNVTGADVGAAAYELLNGDVDLQGAAMLNSADAVFKGSIPSNQSIPTDGANLLVAGGQAVPQDPELGFFEVTLDVQAVARNKADGTVADEKRLGAISKRVCDLLTGHGTLTKAGLRFFDVMLDLVGPPLPNPDAPEESTMLARFTVLVRAV